MNVYTFVAALLFAVPVVAQQAAQQPAQPPAQPVENPMLIAASTGTAASKPANKLCQNCTETVSFLSFVPFISTYNQ